MKLDVASDTLIPNVFFLKKKKTFIDSLFTTKVYNYSVNHLYECIVLFQI